MLCGSGSRGVAHHGWLHEHRAQLLRPLVLLLVCRLVVTTLLHHLVGHAQLGATACVKG